MCALQAFGSSFLSFFLSILLFIDRCVFPSIERGKCIFWRKKISGSMIRTKLEDRDEMDNRGSKGLETDEYAKTMFMHHRGLFALIKTV